MRLLSRRLVIAALVGVAVTLLVTLLGVALTRQRSAPGSFVVRGTTIFDPQGRPFVPQGVNISGPGWVWERDPTQDADLIGPGAWNFNLVRVNACILADATCLGYPKRQTVTADAIVRAFADRGIVVLFEAHDRTGGYFTGAELTTLVDWHRTLARRYRNNPYVWFDVMNEPGGNCTTCAETYPDRAAWDETHQAVVRAIRDEARAENIIVVEGASWGQDAGSRGAEPVRDPESALLSSFPRDVAEFGGRRYGNIVASIHIYEQWAEGDARLPDFLDRALAVNRMPILIGEYGSYNERDTTAATRAMFAAAVPRGIGRVVWAWDGGDRNDLTTGDDPGGGWQINDRTRPTNLTWLGQRVWDDNHAPKARTATATRA